MDRVLKTLLSMSWPEEVWGADAAVRRDAVVAWDITRAKGMGLLHFYPLLYRTPNLMNGFLSYVQV